MNDKSNAIAIMTYIWERIGHYDGYGLMIPHALPIRF